MLKLTLKRIRRWLLIVTVVGGGLLLVSGQWTDRWIWAYIATLAAVTAYGVLLLDDNLAQERLHPPHPGADSVQLRFVRLSAFAHIIVGALDVGRWHLTPTADAVRALGLAGFAVSAFLTFRAMHANQFFSSVVRIQHERGHRVVDSGPYARIRHPGYAGMIVMVPFSGLALGSWASVALALLYSALVLRRVLFEDDFLKKNLTGYREYADRVRYRLVPGVF